MNRKLPGSAYPLDTLNQYDTTSNQTPLNLTSPIPPPSPLRRPLPRSFSSASLPTQEKDLFTKRSFTPPPTTSSPPITLTPKTNFTSIFSIPTDILKKSFSSKIQSTTPSYTLNTLPFDVLSQIATLLFTEDPEFILSIIILSKDCQKFIKKYLQNIKTQNSELHSTLIQILKKQNFIRTENQMKQNIFFRYFFAGFLSAYFTLRGFMQSNSQSIPYEFNKNYSHLSIEQLKDLTLKEGSDFIQRILQFDENIQHAPLPFKPFFFLQKCAFILNAFLIEHPHILSFFLGFSIDYALVVSFKPKNFTPKNPTCSALSPKACLKQHYINADQSLNQSNSHLYASYLIALSLAYFFYSNKKTPTLPIIIPLLLIACITLSTSPSTT